MIINKEEFLDKLYKDQKTACKSILNADPNAVGGDANWLRVGTWKHKRESVMQVWLTPENCFLVSESIADYYIGFKQTVGNFYFFCQDVVALKNFLDQSFEDVFLGQKAQNNKDLVYIAGPMNGLDNWNYDSFNQAEKELLDKGYRVVNPARLCPIDGLEKDQSKGQNGRFSTAMRTCIKAMLDCSVIVLLPGWEKSRGARLERHIADNLYIPVFLLENFLEKLNPDGTKRLKTVCQPYWCQYAATLSNVDYAREIQGEWAQHTEWVHEPDPKTQTIAGRIVEKEIQDTKAFVKGVIEQIQEERMKKAEDRLYKDESIYFDIPGRKISMELDLDTEQAQEIKNFLKKNNELEKQEMSKTSKELYETGLKCSDAKFDLNMAIEAKKGLVDALYKNQEEQVSDLALDGVAVHPTQVEAYEQHEQIAKYRGFTISLAEQVLNYLFNRPYIMQKSVLFAIGVLNIRPTKMEMTAEALAVLKDDIETKLRTSEAIYQHFQGKYYEYFQAKEEQK